jgi:hypothetical protein
MMSEDSKVLGSEDLVMVHTISDEVEQALLTGILEAAEIHYVVEELDNDGLEVMETLSHGTGRLLVLEEDVEEAQELIAQALEDQEEEEEQDLEEDEEDFDEDETDWEEDKDWADKDRD